MSGPVRPWHAWYQRFAPASTEVYALQVLEPTELDEWAVKLRQEFPTVPPNGIEMCHARWLETLDRLIEDIGDAKFGRRAHWCGDIPPETIAGLGLRRRILQAWLKNTPRDHVLRELAEGLGRPPDICDLLYDLLGDLRTASQVVRQDIEVLADMFSGPFEAGNAPIMAKWRARFEGLRERNSVLAQLGERYYPVLTNLCNYRTLTDADRLIGMVARQSIEPDVLGPCNWSLKFLLQDEPERLSASLAAVWALHQFAAPEFHARIEQTPLGVRDQVNAFSKRLGHSDPTKAWLAASLGFVVKKWVRRAWHIMEIEIPDAALPDFSFPEAVKAREEGGELISLSGQPVMDRTTTKLGKHEVIAASSGARRSKAPSLASLPTATPADDEAPAESPPDGDDGTEQGPAMSGSSAALAGAPPEVGDSRLSSATLDQGGGGAGESAEPAPAEHPDASETAADADWERPSTIGGTTRILTATYKTERADGEANDTADQAAAEGNGNSPTGA